MAEQIGGKKRMGPQTTKPGTRSSKAMLIRIKGKRRMVTQRVLEQLRSTA